MLSTEELYEGLPKEQAAAWRQEAINKWADAVERSENHLRKKSKQDFEHLKKSSEQNWLRLIALSKEDPTSEKVQAEIGVHYELIREFWGTAGSPDKQAEAYAGLGDLYINDERFTMVDGVANPTFAAFMNKAMKHFAKKLKE